MNSYSSGSERRFVLNTCEIVFLKYLDFGKMDSCNIEKVQEDWNIGHKHTEREKDREINYK